MLRSKLYVCPVCGNVIHGMAKERNMKALFLTCLADKVEMYLKFGFEDLGIAESSWGGEEWHEMRYDL